MLKYDSDEEFVVQRGFLNRTRIYLYPAIVLLKSYRPYMVDLKENLLCCSYSNDKIIIYYDRKNTIAIHELVKALKRNNEYINDYMYNENVYAVEVSPELNYAAFEEGAYSDIYTPEQLALTFTFKSKTRAVLSKDPEYKQEYVNLLNNWFNTHYTIDSLESRPNGQKVEISQYDIPPCLNQEILGYEKSNKINNGFIK